MGNYLLKINRLLQLIILSYSLLLLNTLTNLKRHPRLVKYCSRSFLLLRIGYWIGLNDSVRVKRRIRS